MDIEMFRLRMGSVEEYSLSEPEGNSAADKVWGQKKRVWTIPAGFFHIVPFGAL